MPADKGGSVVVLDADHYRQMVKSIFDDPDYFEPCLNSQSKEIFLEITSLCRKYANNLTKDEIKFLSKFDSKEANFYGLPKVHKSEIIKRAILEQKSEVVIVPCPSDLKVRPIIGGPASPTSHLSMFIDTLLKPYMLKLPSYVRDSIDLLNHAKAWENDESEDYVLLSMDVEAMYMNISESLGLKAITYFLEKYPDLLPARIPTDFVVEATRLVLRNNVSYFDGEYRRQTHGCAMGSHKSPPYSSLAIGYLESQLHERNQNTYGEAYAAYVLKMLERFLDDIFLKWRCSLGDPYSLLRDMNNLDPKIRFTMEMGKSLPFLDVRFTLTDSNELETDIYYKATDSHNYVPFFSFHPHKTLTNIPYSLARRICTIVSMPQRRDTRLRELQGNLEKKQYPTAVILNGIERAKSIDRDSLLQPQDIPPTDKNLPFVHTYNSANPQVLDIIRQSTSILAPSERMKSVMDGRKIIAARRQPPNLKSLLFRPRFEGQVHTTPGSVTACCKIKRKARGQPCKCCDNINECSSFLFHGSNEPFELRWHFNCDTMNILYALTCQTCGLNYIGQTERSVRERNGDYRRAISDKKYHTQGVHEHLANCGKGHYLITPFFKIKSTNRGHQTILQYETYFIQKFKPALNESKLGK